MQALPLKKKGRNRDEVRLRPADVQQMHGLDSGGRTGMVLKSDTEEEEEELVRRRVMNIRR